MKLRKSSRSRRPSPSPTPLHRLAKPPHPRSATSSIRTDEERASIAASFLDPYDTIKTGVWTPIGLLPAAVRAFGGYFDTSALVPGDLILVHAKRPSHAQRAIIRAQRRGGFAPDDARWHHAAVYTGEDSIIEALLHGVRHNPLFSHIPKCLLRVRRDPNLADPQKTKPCGQGHVEHGEILFSDAAAPALSARSTKLPATCADRSAVLCHDLF